MTVKMKPMTPKAAKRISKSENDKSGLIPEKSFAQRARKAAKKNLL